MLSTNSLLENIPHYLSLMRFDKPIGWLLLLWPTLWALWIASGGNPPTLTIWIFTLGVIVMRSAGCVINDYADRDFDSLVSRTKQRPLAAGLLVPKQALGLFVILCAVALILLLLLPMRVWPWSIPAIIITIAYPFMKRFIQAPQAVLGLAFSFGIPMVYVSQQQPFDLVFWLLILINFLWVIAFDTTYAMSDRDDDLKIGVKSTAILFGRYDRLVIALLHVIIISLLVVLMLILGRPLSFVFTIAIVTGMFVYQQWLIRGRESQACFQAFLNNGWVGAAIWFGLLSDF